MSKEGTWTDIDNVAILRIAESFLNIDSKRKGKIREKIIIVKNKSN